jgi:hypothetical protein
MPQGPAYSSSRQWPAVSNAPEFWQSCSHAAKKSCVKLPITLCFGGGGRDIPAPAGRGHPRARDRQRPDFKCGFPRGTVAARHPAASTPIRTSASYPRTGLCHKPDGSSHNCNITGNIPVFPPGISRSRIWSCGRRSESGNSMEWAESQASGEVSGLRRRGRTGDICPDQCGTGDLGLLPT